MTVADPAAGAARLRELAAREAVLLPGVYDALSARIAAQAGFDALFVSGYAVSAVRLGEPDLGLLTQSEMAEAARSVCRVGDGLPVLVDADTGYGNALNVLRTVGDLLDAGAAGVFLEDQAWPKRCGHMEGKRVIAAEEHTAKLRAAREAAAGRDVFLVARTDARQPLGLDVAIERALAYKEAGADALFVEAPRSVAELERIGAALPGPLVASMVEGGATPQLNREQLETLGFALIIGPVSALYAATRAVSAVLAELRAHGTTAGTLDRLVGFDDFNELIGLRARLAQDARFGTGT